MADVCCTIVFNGENEVLMLKRARNTSSPGTWNFPGGSEDEGETRWQTAARELYEEANIVVQKEDLKYIGNITFDYDPSRKIHFFIGEKFSGDVKINWESSEFKWVPVDEIQDYEFPGGKLNQKLQHSIEMYLEDNND